MNNAQAILSAAMAPAALVSGWFAQVRHSLLRRRQMRSLAFAIRSGLLA
jgi:hypothetical protein